MNRMKAKAAKRTWTILFPALFLGLSMFTALIISARIGVGMVEQVVPLQKASMMIKSELSLFQVSLEQSVYVVKAGYYENVWAHLDKAEWYAQAMLEGGKDKEGVYIPLKDPELRREIMLVLTKLKELRSLAKQRITMGAGKASESRVENQFNMAITMAWQQADTVEATLRGSISEQMVEYEAITIGLLIGCALFTVLTGFALYRYGSRRAAAIAALTESEDRLKKNEKELMAALERLRLLSTAVEEAPDGIQLVGLDGRIEYSNKAVEEIYGSTPEEFAGKNVNDLNVDPEFADKVILPAVREKGLWVGELMVKHKRGTAFPILLSASLVRDDGGSPIAMVGIIRDITARKALERQRADLYAMVTHDLKSPLSAILGYSELLLTDKAEKLDTDTLDIVTGIQRSGDKVLNIVEDFLTFSRLESGKVSLNESFVEIAKLIQESCVEFRLQAAEKGLTMVVEPPGEMPRAFIDKRLVDRALQNIIQNAVIYTPPGGSVTVKAGVSVDNGGKAIVISVTDTGPGIPAEDQARVFEKYYRSQRTAGVKGTGLGLSIVKAVAEAHGGKVELDSAEGKGSTFRLFLPVGE